MSTAKIVSIVERVAGSGLPELVVNESDPTETAKALRDLIAERGTFLSNGYCPVMVVVDGDNLPRAVEVTPEMVRIHTNEICRPVKIKKGKVKKGEIEKDKIIPVAISRDVATLYLRGLEGQWNLKPFRGITTSPILKNDGTLRSANGYDEESGLWCHNIPHLNLPERPTETDAKEALRRIRHFFRTFRLPTAVGNWTRISALKLRPLAYP